MVRKKRLKLNTEMDIKREQPVFDLLGLVLGGDFISKFLAYGMTSIEMR